MARRTIRVGLIEENRMMRERLAVVIRGMRDFTLVADSPNVLEFSYDWDAAPDLILFDLDASGAETLPMIGRLLLMLPEVEIICMSKRWEEDVAHNVIEAGAVGYVIKPFTGEELLRVVKSLGEKSKGQQLTSEVISFFSPKGKSGKTTVIVNLAVALAKKTGQSVGIIDADTSFADMGVFLNLNPKSTIFEAVRDLNFLSPPTLASYFEEAAPQVKVLCGIKRPELAGYVKAEDLTDIIRMARSAFRYVLVDTPQGFNSISVAASEASDYVYLTAMLSGTYELEHMRRTLEIFQAMDDWERRVKVLLTRASMLDEQTVQRLSKEVGYPVELIPNEYALVSTAANNGRMALDIGPDSAMTRQINKLADSVCMEA